MLDRGAVLPTPLPAGEPAPAFEPEASSGFIMTARVEPSPMPMPAALLVGPSATPEAAKDPSPRTAVALAGLREGAAVPPGSMVAIPGDSNSASVLVTSTASSSSPSWSWSVIDDTADARPTDARLSSPSASLPPRLLAVLPLPRCRKKESPLPPVILRESTRAPVLRKST